MKIEVMKVNDLIPYENNAKLHPKEQIEQIVKSIKEFGFNDPIAIDENNVIIEGHGRLLAIKQMNYKECEVIKLTHLTAQQKKAYILAHNKLTLNSDFDLEMLEIELCDIDEIDMTDFGFDITLLTDEFGEDFTLPDGDKEPFQQITFTLADNQAELIKSALNIAKQDIDVETFGNENSNGNGIYRIVSEWVELKK